MEDNELMARLALGDTEALAQLIARHRPFAEQLAFSLLRDRATAEDVTQEAFARVYLMRQQYQPTFTFRTYLGVIVRRLCIDQHRRELRAPVTLGEMPEGEVESAESMCLARERRMELWTRLEQLPATDRELLTGYALEGLSYRDLARRQQMSLAQVKVRLHRVRKRLQKQASEKECDDL